MNLSTIQYFFTHQWLILTWRDYIEITFFSSCFYTISQWLKRDQEKNLLAYFYMYCVIAFSAYALEFSTISYVLFIFSPAIILLFMMMHQETLQRNLITLKNFIIPAKSSMDWMAMLMQTILKALNTNQPLLFLIEHSDALTPFLKTQYFIDAPLTQGLLDLILENKVYDLKKLIWISSTGNCKGINVAFKASWHPASYTNKDAWVDDALAHSSKTDAIIMYVNPEEHTCSIAIKGHLHKGLSVEQASMMISKHIGYQITSNKKGLEYDITSAKGRLAQRST